VASVGEPLQYRVSGDDLTAKLRQVGFRNVHLVTPEEIATRYLRDRSDGLRPPRRTTLARAWI
jgi:hypothetical protein